MNPRFSFLIALGLGSFALGAAEPAGVEQVGPSAGTQAAEASWVFDPPQGRIDIFYDLEERMEMEKALLEKPEDQPGGISLAPALEDEGAIEAALEWGRREAERIDKLILSRRWDEAIQACDKANKSLEKFQEHAEIRSLRESIARARSQAYEAKIFEEAKNQFDALGIKVEGVLWSPDGSLAVLADEPRALRINDRTRDTTIVNIDTNRVDFLFTYEQRRFEFQRYVGEEVNVRPGSAPSRR